MLFDDNVINKLAKCLERTGHSDHGLLQGFVTPANLDSAVEHRNLHADRLFKSGLSEELQVFNSHSLHDILKGDLVLYFLNQEI